MSTPKKFSELPLASYIGSDKLLVVDNTGVKRVAKPEPYPEPRRTLPYASDDADTWYRIANISKSGLGLVFIKQIYSYASPCSVILAVAADGWGTNPQTGSDIRLLAGNPKYFKEARIVTDVWNTDNSAWLDVLVAKSNNAGDVYIFGVNIFAVGQVTKNPSIESALSVKEFDLTKSGGVICCTAVGPYRVTVTQKGGLHEHTGETNSGMVEISADGAVSFGSIDAACQFIGQCDEMRSLHGNDVPRSNFRSKRGKNVRDIHSGIEYNVKCSDRGHSQHFRLNHECRESSELLRATLHPIVWDISLQTILQKRAGLDKLDKVHKRIVRKEVVVA